MKEPNAAINTVVNRLIVQRPTQHTKGHFRDDFPSQSLDWCKSPVFSTDHLAI